MNYVNYTDHVLYEPDTYHRRFDLDLPESGELAIRVALVALPWISLYRPAGYFISIGMNFCRVIQHLYSAFLSKEEKVWWEYGVLLLQTAVAVVALVGSFFYFVIGLYLTTAADLCESFVRAGHCFYRGEWAKGLEEFAQALASALYLAFMVTGQLEMILAFACVQGLVSLYQARGEFEKGHYLEAISKIAWAGMRVRQVNHYRTLIQRRNKLRAMEQYYYLMVCSLKGRQVRHLISNPLAGDLQGTIDGRAVRLSDGQENYDLGSYFHGYGEGMVKGMNLQFRTITVNGKEMVELEFKVNHVYRKNIDETLRMFSKMKPKETQEVLAIMQSHVKGIQVKKGNLTVGDTNMDGGWWHTTSKNSTVVLEGLGSVSICTDKSYPNLYNRVTVQMDSSKTLFDLHEMVAFMNLEGALKSSSDADVERLQLAQLFHNFCPRQAFPFERSEQFFTLPIEELKQEMVKRAPAMEQVLEKYGNRLQVEEILPGKVAYRIDGLADEVAANGGRALISAVTGAYSDQELFQRVEGMLRMGMLSSEMRYGSNMGVGGLGGSSIDFLSGGSDRVFTQMLTEKNCRDQLDLSELYSSKVRIVISLKALETGTYQYYDPEAGSRTTDPNAFFFDGQVYRSRPDILEFTRQLQKGGTDMWGDWRYSGNEVMLKDRIDPSDFQGIIVSNQKTYNALVNHLRAADLIQRDGAGNETIFNQAVNRFIRVGTKVSEDLLNYTAYSTST